MEDPDTMIGPVAEALGVTGTWLLGSDDPLHEHIDLPVSLMVELMDAADTLYPTEEQRWRQLRGWLSRLTGRPAAEFERAAPLMEAVRRQFRLSRDEDLQAVSVWRRAQPTPAELSKLQLTVRPENGSRLRRLVQQLGSEEAAIDFLLQMDDNCGKGASLRRTRWPPKVHYESSRGQVKIDVGTEMVCVVLSQFKPAPAPEPVPAPEPETLPTPPPPHSAVEVVSAAPEVLVVNGHVPVSDATPAGSAAPPLSLASASAYQTVVRDATLPAQMFADDDLAADQLSEVQNQLTSVLDQLEDSNQMADMPPAGGVGQTDLPPAVVGEQVVTEQTIGDVAEMVVTGEEKVVMEAGDVTEDSSVDMVMTAQTSAVAGGAAVAGLVGEETEEHGSEMGLGDSQVTLGGEEITLEGEEVALEGEEIALEGEEIALDSQEIALDSEEVTLDSQDVSLEGEEVALEGEEVALEGEVVLDHEVSLEGEEVALDSAETPLDSEDTGMSADTGGALEDSSAPSDQEPALQSEEVSVEAELPSDISSSEQLTEITEITEVTEPAAEQLVQVEPLVELPEQLMESEEPEPAAGPSSAGQHLAIDADQLSDAAAEQLSDAAEQLPDDVAEQLPDDAEQMPDAAEQLPDATAEQLSDDDVTTEQLPDAAAEQPLDVAEQLPDAATEQLPDAATEQLPDAAADKLSDAPADQLSDAAAEQLPDATAEQQLSDVAEQMSDAAEQLPDAAEQQLSGAAEQQLPAAAAEQLDGGQGDEPMAEVPDEPMDVGGEEEATDSPQQPAV